MNVVYVSQFRDCSGYASAARGYLKAIDLYLQKNPGSFNLKVHTIPVENSKTSRLNNQEKDLLDKYEFESEEEISNYCEKEYLAIWHMPATMIYMLKSNPTNPFWRTAVKLIGSAKENINLTVWEADEVPDEWISVYDQLNTNSVIVPCTWNQEVFSKKLKDKKCHLLPHVMDNKIVDPKPIGNLEKALEGKFVVFSMSQWHIRKGFDKLIKAFSMEFSSNPDAVLVIKSYVNIMESFLEKFPMKQQATMMANEIKAAKSSIYMPNGSQSDGQIMLVADTLPFENISWLHNRADIFALLTRAEGFGLTIAEALLHKTPVLVPAATGYMDFTHQNSAFFVDGHWRPYESRPEYHCDMNWYEPHINSARLQLRRAYEMWKHNSLEEKGFIGWEHIQNLKMDKENIGIKMASIIEGVRNKIDSEKENIDINFNVDGPSQKVSFLKAKIEREETTEEKLKILKDKFKNEDCYILSCGPSLRNYSPDLLREKLKDKLVIAIKQAYDYVPDIVDIHMFNCNNFKPYNYGTRFPLVLTTAGEPEQVIVNNVWTKNQKYDIFLPVVNSNQDFNNTLAVTKDFGSYTLEETKNRPWGPGMMYELGLYLTHHLGVKNVYTIGWDLERPGETKSTHFYDAIKNNINIIRKSDPMRPKEIEKNIEASQSFFEWLKSQGINLYVASKDSHVHEDVPRQIIGN